MLSLTLEDRAVGAYLGLAIGDALGATVEFMTKTEIAYQYGTHCRMIGGGWLHLKPGQVTDDTQMALYLGRALLAADGWDPKQVCLSFAEWLKSKPVDVGSTCRRGIRRFITEGSLSAPYNDGDAGNGAAMRNLPVILAAHDDPARLGRWTIEQAHVTHNHPFSDAATLALAEMTAALLHGGGVRTVRTRVNALIEQHKAFKFRPYKGLASAYIVDTMQTVMHHYFRTDDFASCLIDTVNQGGDADTTGAIAGMLAGATYGVGDIPQGWLKKLDPAIRTEIESQVPKLLALAQRG
ncbi:MAG: ADP-ribosyl-[dinitrogen reductase] hydrolase [Rhodospirillaceae bacterium]|nr:ADP-ribosyl-[dinitrogen reductase] hydrolase [Rhodospirillaceae bacterium]